MNRLIHYIMSKWTHPINEPICIIHSFIVHSFIIHSIFIHHSFHIHSSFNHHSFIIQSSFIIICEECSMPPTIGQVKFRKWSTLFIWIHEGWSWYEWWWGIQNCLSDKGVQCGVQIYPCKAALPLDPLVLQNKQILTFWTMNPTQKSNIVKLRNSKINHKFNAPKIAMRLSVTTVSR